MGFAEQPLRLGRQLQEQVLGVSHKLISPMSSVCELAQSISRATSTNQRDKYINHIIAESSRAVHTARTLLRGSAGERIRPTLTSCDLKEILTERLAPYLTLLRADKFKCKVRFPKESLLVRADPDLLGSIFAEFADNARTALLASDEPRGAGFFRVTCWWNREQTVSSVLLTNSGKPIPEGLRGRLFERYVSGTGSTGLGLPLVLAVVQAHGGQVSLLPTRKGWTRFLVTFPAGQK